MASCDYERFLEAICHHQSCPHSIARQCNAYKALNPKQKLRSLRFQQKGNDAQRQLFSRSQQDGRNQSIYDFEKVLNMSMMRSSSWTYLGLCQNHKLIDFCYEDLCSQLDTVRKQVYLFCVWQNSDNMWGPTIILSEIANSECSNLWGTVRQKCEQEDFFITSFWLAVMFLPALCLADQKCPGEAAWFMITMMVMMMVMQLVFLILTLVFL